MLGVRGRVGLVSEDRVWPGARPPWTAAFDAQVRQQVGEHGRVIGLAGPDEDHQRPAAAVDELVDLR